MPRVLGIDSSLTATGLCRVDVDTHKPSAFSATEHELTSIDVCTVSAPKPNPHDKSHRAMARRVTALLDQIEAALEGVDLVAMEELAYGAKGAAAWVLPWIWGEIIRLCEKHDVKLVIVNVSCVKKYATGKGNADKDTVLLAASRRYADVGITNNNEADATVIAAIGCRYLGLPIDQVPKVNLEFMSKIAS
jgi:Holliday junction resolvasome RuvABC endonuclease subunit